MANTLAYSVIFLAVLNLTSCYHEEDLKSGIRDGIVKLYDDLKNDALNENTFDYFPKEVEEAIPQIRKYFMGKTQDSLTSQVLYMMYIITNSNIHGVECVMNMQYILIYIYQTNTGSFSPSCTGCVVGVDTIYQLSKNGTSMALIETILNVICRLSMEKEVCSGAIKGYMVTDYL